MDHEAHKDSLKFKVCKFIGSACSLVAQQVEQHEELLKADLAHQPEEMPPNLAYLLAAPIVLDTHFFDESLKNSKWQEEDLVAHKFLTKFADVGKHYWH